MFWFGVLPEHASGFTTDGYLQLTGGTRRSLDQTLIAQEIGGQCLTPLLATVTLESRLRQRRGYVLVYRDDDLNELIQAWNFRAQHGPPIVAIPLRFLDKVHSDLVESAERWLAGVDPEHAGRHIRVDCVGSAYDKALPLFESHALSKAVFMVMPASLPQDPRYSDELDYQNCAMEIRTGGSRPANIDQRYFRITFPEAALIAQSDFEWGSVCVHVELSSNYDGDFCSLVLPEDVLAASYLLGAISETVTRSAVGWSCSVKPNDRELTLRIPAGTDLVEWWFQKHGLSCKQTVAGRIAERILAMSSGPWGVPGVCHPPALAVYNSMVDGPMHAGYHEPRWKTKDQIKGILSKHADELPHGLKSAETAFGRLLASGALAGGVEVPCTACGTRNFYRPKELDESLTCSTCLTRFDLPLLEVDAKPWRFRPQGPFAVPRRAQGGYAVACALAHLVKMNHHPVAFMAGAEIGEHGAEASLFDIDAVLFQQVDDRLCATRVVFLECKHNAPFTERDIERAEWLHHRFPNVIQCFATLRTGLDDQEYALLRGLLPKLRQSRKLKGARPLLLLTGTEINASVGAEHAWKTRGGRWAQLGRDYGRWTNRYADYCVATQYLYLTSSEDGNPYRAVDELCKSSAS